MTTGDQMLTLGPVRTDSFRFRPGGRESVTRRLMSRVRMANNKEMSDTARHGARTLAALTAMLMGAFIQPAAAKPDPEAAAARKCADSLKRGGKVQVVKSKPVGRKRVVFVRSKVVITVDHDDLVRIVQAFLKKNGAHRFRDEQRALAAFAGALKKSDTVKAAALLGAKEQRRMDFQIAAALQGGRFELRDLASKKTYRSLVVSTFNFSCGPLCGRGGRTFYLPGCKVFFTVTDWVS